MRILYADKRILVCVKDVGVVSTDQEGGVPDLLRRQLGEERSCMRTVHRLDQVVGGVMVLARSRRAAQLLSAQIRTGGFEKEYLAAVQGQVLPERGTLRDLLRRDTGERRTVVAREPGKDVREAVLHYETLAVGEAFSLVRVRLETGRTHQIRCQFAHRGWPLAGDVKYGARAQEMEGVGLWSCMLAFDHPETGERMRFSAPPPSVWPWTLWGTAVESAVEQAPQPGEGRLVEHQGRL